MFKETHPILGRRDIQRSIDFCTGRLGLRSFSDKADPSNYIGFVATRSGSTCSFDLNTRWDAIRLRFLVEHPDALFDEYQQRGVRCSQIVRDRPWMTREIALGGVDYSGLTSYRKPTSAEKVRHIS